MKPKVTRRPAAKKARPVKAVAKKSRKQVVTRKVAKRPKAGSSPRRASVARRPSTKRSGGAKKSRAVVTSRARVAKRTETPKKKVAGKRAAAEAKRAAVAAAKGKRAAAVEAKRAAVAAAKSKRAAAVEAKSKRAAVEAKRAAAAEAKRAAAAEAKEAAAEAKREAAEAKEAAKREAAEAKRAKPARRAEKEPARTRKSDVAPAPRGSGRPGARQSSRPPIAVKTRSSRPPASRHVPSLVSLPIPLLPTIKRLSLEERAAQIEGRLNAQSEEFRRRYIDSFDMSWIYHDSALEGVVYTFEELRAGLSGQVLPVTDSAIQPVCEDIRRHKEAIDFVRDFASKKRLPVTLDVLKKIYLILRPEEGDVKTVKYRKDVPQHRLYFHEYAPPDKIAYKMRQIVDWLNDPETRKTRNGIRIAARAHYDILRVYPFATESGKVARLFMNLLLLRGGLPPSLIHSTERQRYYEALKGSATTVLQMVQESVENALTSVEKVLDEHETKMRGFVS